MILKIVIIFVHIGLLEPGIVFSWALASNNCANLNTGETISTPNNIIKPWVNPSVSSKNIFGRTLA